jgi:hypothetical protein
MLNSGKEIRALRDKKNKNILVNGYKIPYGQILLFQ